MAAINSYTDHARMGPIWDDKVRPKLAALIAVLATDPAHREG